MAPRSTLLLQGPPYGPTVHLMPPPSILCPHGPPYDSRCPPCYRSLQVAVVFPPSMWPGKVNRNRGPQPDFPAYLAQVSRPLQHAYTVGKSPISHVNTAAQLYGCTAGLQVVNPTPSCKADQNQLLVILQCVVVHSGLVLLYLTGHAVEERLSGID